MTVAPSGRFEGDRAVAGVYRNCGEQVEASDRGERDWMTEYHAHANDPGAEAIFRTFTWKGLAPIGAEELQ